MNSEVGFLEDLEECGYGLEIPFENSNILSESSLVPKVGHYLGLDISDLSSGITIYRDGKKIVANIELEEVSKDDCHYEVKMRRLLKTYMRELFLGESFELILIEDAYQGINPETTRLLYALNTAIDELIIDGELVVRKFKRVPNKAWKSWLFKVDKENHFKGMKDKPRIEACLRLLGVYEEGEGFQDRLDSCGMLLGYFLQESEILKKEVEDRKKKVAFADIEYDYQEDEDLVVLSAGYGVRSIERRYVELNSSWSKQKMIDLLSEDPSTVVISKGLVKLGNLGATLGLPIIRDGGYFAFWVSEKRLKKYLSKEQVEAMKE